MNTQYDVEIPTKSKPKNKYKLEIEKFLDTDHKRVAYTYLTMEEARREYRAFYNNSYVYGVKVIKRELSVILERR